MDFGMMNFALSAGAENGGGTSVWLSEPETRGPNNSQVSGYLKQDRSGYCEENDIGSKVARTDDCVGPKRTLLHQENTTCLLRSNSVKSGDDAQNMLSFSSTKAEIPFLGTVGGERRTDQTQSSVFSLFQQASASSRTAGYSYGRFGSDICGPIAFRGPFTQSQWMELEHQVLIYRHIVAKVSIPSNLLNSLKKSLNPYAFSGWSSGSYNPNILGWRSFHLGFPGNTDPEPGRCRRTDGKKWRCSRDAVPDQKYCERHINRGRHRSRKPVEGQTGHAVSESTAPKVSPIASSTSATVMSSSGSCATIQNHFKYLHGAANFPTDAANCPTDALISRKEVTQGLLPPTINFKSKGSPYCSHKRQSPFKDSTWPGFGLVTSASLLNPSRGNSFLDSKNCSSLLNSNDHEMHDHHPLRHFIDDWPKDQSDRITVSWPEDLKSDWTKLSMSIPLDSSAFSSTSNSPQQDKLTLSSLRLSHEFDPIQMGLGVSSDLSEQIQKQANWIPISWGNSVGGPLGEVLSSTSSTVGACKNPYAVTITSEAWDGSPKVGSSPTGVLQGSTLVSLSNSSAGSSPRTDKRAHEGASIDDVFG